MANVYPSQGGVMGIPYPSLKYILGILGSSGFGSSSTAEQVAASWDGTGRVVVITGASCGLGAEAARVLAARGARVVMLGRDAPAMEQLVASIRATHSAAHLDIIPCDLSDLHSVVDAAKAVLKLGAPLHVLMLNAGVMACPLAATSQGVELQLGVNHVAHYLLTRLLLPRLIETASAPGAAEGRVVVLSSAAHAMARAPQDLRLLRDGSSALSDAARYRPWDAYGRSKLANILFARELCTRLTSAGITNVAVAAVHPGGIPATRLPRHLGVPKAVQAVLLPLIRPVFKSIPQGAATQVFVATAPGPLPSGEYWADCNLAAATAAAHDADLGRALWEGSENVVAQFVGEAKGMAGNGKGLQSGIRWGGVSS